MYAIIEDSGTQIKVSQGDTIKIDPRQLADDTDTLTFDKVLLTSTGEDGGLKVGAPYVDGATVTASILEEGRGKKIEVVKFKRRKNYIRRRGHRQPFIKVQITDISA